MKMKNIYWAMGVVLVLGVGAVQANTADWSPGSCLHNLAVPVAEELNFLPQIQNTGSNGLADVELHLDLAPGTTLEKVAGAGYTLMDGHLICHLDELGVGDVRNLLIKLLVQPDAEGTILTNDFSLSWNGTWTGSQMETNAVPGDSPAERAYDIWLAGYGLSSSTHDINPDNDGYTTDEEYVLDTDPTTKTLGVELVMKTEDGLKVLANNTSPDRRYTLQVRDSLLGGEWQDVPMQQKSAAGSLLFECETGNGSNAYYRVKIDLK